MSLQVKRHLSTVAKETVKMETLDRERFEFARPSRHVDRRTAELERARLGTSSFKAGSLSDPGARPDYPDWEDDH